MVSQLRKPVVSQLRKVVQQPNKRLLSKLKGQRLYQTCASATRQLSETAGKSIQADSAGNDSTPTVIHPAVHNIQIALVQGTLWS